MANDQFTRILRFATRTGDRLIVTDPSGNEPVVIMSLDEYEALALGSGDFSMMDVDKDEDTYGKEDEYGEAPTLEIIESMADEAIVTEPTTPTAAMPVAPAAADAPRRDFSAINLEKRTDPSEEQFYLEPL